MNAYLPGPGDESTWPTCSGHPIDPRNDEDEAIDNAAALADEIRCALARASEAIERRDAEAAAAALEEIETLFVVRAAQ